MERISGVSGENRNEKKGYRENFGRTIGIFLLDIGGTSRIFQEISIKSEEYRGDIGGFGGISD